MCILRSVVFGMHNRIQHISPPILGRVLLDLPGLLFFTTYTLLVRAPSGKLWLMLCWIAAALPALSRTRPFTPGQMSGQAACVTMHAAFIRQVPMERDRSELI